MSDVFTPAEITTDVETVNTGSAFEALVGDGKKFKDNEALARSALEKDRFIAQLQQEARGRQAELERLAKSNDTNTRLEEIMTRLSTNPSLARNEETPSATPAVPTVTEADIQSIVARTLAAEAEKSRGNQNAMTVVGELKKLYGNDYAPRLEQRTAELGMTKDEMNTLAARSPAAFLALVSPVQRPNTTQQSRSFVNPESFSNQSSGEQDYSYFEKMRTSADPMERARYWLPATQMKIHNLGEKAVNDGTPDRFFK